MLSDTELLLDMLADGDGHATDRLPDARTLRREGKGRLIKLLKREHLATAFPGLPEPGYTYHVIANGKFDFWSFIPVLVERLGGAVEEFYGSTWTMSRANANELLTMIDAGAFQQVAILAGEEFKSRETAVFGTLTEGLAARKQRYVISPNHAKVVLLRAGAHRLVIEGSANFTSNPRTEQYCLGDDAEWYAFHRGWMEEVLHAGQTQ